MALNSYIDFWRENPNVLKCDFFSYFETVWKESRDPKSFLELFLFSYTHFQFHGFFFVSHCRAIWTNTFTYGRKSERTKQEDKEVFFPFCAKKGTFERESYKWTIKLHAEKKSLPLKT